MATGFSVTFERFFPHDDGEDICEADESGFVIENASLGDAIRLGLEYARPEWCGRCEPDSYPARNVRSLAFYQWNDCTRENLETGISESRSLHFPDSLTESSRIRVCRLLRAIK